MAGSEIQQTIYNMEKKKMRKHTLIVGILSFIILLLAGVGFWAYCLILAPDFEPRKTVYVYIDEKKDFDSVVSWSTLPVASVSGVSSSLPEC